MDRRTDVARMVVVGIECPWMRRFTTREVKGMETLLERAFAEAAKLPKAEQDVLAARLLAELAVEDEFDRLIAESAHKLSRLADQAVVEFRKGSTEILDPDRL